MHTGDNYDKLEEGRISKKLLQHKTVTILTYLHMNEFSLVGILGKVWVHQ